MPMRDNEIPSLSSEKVDCKGCNHATCVSCTQGVVEVDREVFDPLDVCPCGCYNDFLEQRQAYYEEE